MEVPQKTKSRVAIWSSSPTPGHIPDKTIIWKDTCTPMFIAALFTIAKTWKQPKCPLTDEWIKKMWYTSCTVSGNVNWYSHYGEQHGGSLKKLKIELPYDPAIPLLDIYPERTIIQKDTCTTMFIAALFTIARSW